MQGVCNAFAVRSAGYVKSGWEQPAEEARLRNDAYNMTPTATAATAWQLADVTCKARCGHWRVFAARPFEAHELIEARVQIIQSRLAPA